MINRRLLLTVLLVILGVGSLGFAFYLYATMQSMYETFSYYGISRDSMMENPEVSQALWNLKVGIVELILAAIVLFSASAYVVLRVRPKVINE